MIASSIKKLHRHLQSVAPLLLAIDEVLLTEKQHPKKWSKKETLGHLVDSALYNLDRFTKIRFCVPPFEIIPYPQEELVTANRYQVQEIEDILHLWESLNRQILSIWKSYSKEELAISVINPKFDNEGDLAWWINDYLSHLEHHLIQILGSSYKNLSLWFTTPLDAAELLAESTKPFVKLLAHGSMYVEYYAPEFEDLQTPHDQDEIYVIHQGEGVFLNGEIRHSFEAGDVIFVPAGVEHRFEIFSEDFATWVIFYGPKGGEASTLN